MSDYSQERVPVAARVLMELMLTKSATWTLMVDTGDGGFAVCINGERVGSSLYEDVLFKAAIDYLAERDYIHLASAAPHACYQVTFKGLEHADQWQIVPLEPREQQTAVGAAT